MFKPCVLASLFVVALACGKKEETSSSPPPPSPPPAPSPPNVVAKAPPPADAPTTPPPIPDPPSYVVVKPAFGGTVPQFPQLSHDGKSAAIDLSARVDNKMATFEVGFLSDTGKLDHVAVLDRDTAAKLASDPATKVDSAAMQKSASTIAKRLSDGQFSKFPTAIDPGILETFGSEARTKGKDLPIPIDTAKLIVSVVVNKSGPTSLRLRLDNASGKKVTEQLVPGVVGNSHTNDCLAAPSLGGVWYDTERKRLLLQITFMTADCFEVPAKYQLWKLP